MAERIHIPSSPACGQWETLLADALDGLLKPEDEATFASHMAACPACSALFEESQRGREWLEFLETEPEVPEGLLDKILAHTGPGQKADLKWVAVGAVTIPQGSIPAWQRPGFMGFVRRFAEPRLLMTAAMAFFSITVTLNMLGMRLTSLRLSDLRPSAVRAYMERQFTVASVPIIRYYDHLRFVYEVESRMRELRNNATQGEGQGGSRPQAQPRPVAPGESKQEPGHRDGGSKINPPQQSVEPAHDRSNEILETSLVGASSPGADYLRGAFLNLQGRRAHFGSSTMAVRERSMKWTA